MGVRRSSRMVAMRIAREFWRSRTRGRERRGARRLWGTKGFRPGRKENKLGLRASDTSELIFEDCEIPAENLIGKEGEGFKDAMRELDGRRISIAALSLGMARGALDAAMKYAQERRQFGKAISEFQAIQFKLADMATELDAAWLLTMRAAQMKDE